MSVETPSLEESTADGTSAFSTANSGGECEMMEGAPKTKSPQIEKHQEDVLENGKSQPVPLKTYLSVEERANPFLSQEDESEDEINGEHMEDIDLSSSPPKRDQEIPETNESKAPVESKTTISSTLFKSSATYVPSTMSSGDVMEGRLSNSDTSSEAHSQLSYPMSSNLAKSASNVKIGFGNTVSPKSSSTKLSNITLQDAKQAAANKAELVKSWSNTKQVLSEKLGRGTKTVDLELESKIEYLKDTKRSYEHLVNLTKVLMKHFGMIIETQQALGSALGELSTSSMELQEEFRFNSQSNAIIAKNGATLLKAMDSFIAGVSTLCGKTIADTLLTIDKYESARLTFDAYKNELTALSLRPRTPAIVSKQAIAQFNYDEHKVVYESLREDVFVKLQFLEENKVMVMQKNLQLFNSAVNAYFTGNQEELEKSLENYRLNSASNPFLQKVDH